MSLHARIYDVVSRFEERRGLLEWRRALVGELTGEVLELGVGTGRNLRHYPAGARVIASDRDPVMLSRAIPRAERAAAKVRLLVADAMRLPFPDSSADVVVIGLMLCSVPHPQKALAEVARVLRPGGSLRVVEHVRDRDGSVRARVQDAVNPVWRVVSGGCNCNRDTVRSVEEAGFELRRHYEFPIGRSHVAPHVMVDAGLP